MTSFSYFCLRSLFLKQMFLFVNFIVWFYNVKFWFLKKFVLILLFKLIKLYGTDVGEDFTDLI